MVVIGDLMEEEELLTINHKGKSKQKDCLFVCFVCAVEETSSPLEQFTSIIIVTHPALHSSPKYNEEE
jgi:hypothetical protein